ncbi:MAG TPA: phosphotransferase, partial [Planctomycetota bacterium]|nr:phosphotransferase [Planctomycetota bacterium]
LPGRDIRAAEIRYLKYRPQRYCRASYRIDIGGAECDVDAFACPREELSDSVEHGRDGAVPGPLGSGRVVLDDVAVLVTVFPNDARLSQIADLTDPERRGALLSALLPERPELWNGEVRCLSYWPGRRYAAELRAADGSRAFLKALTRRSYRRAMANAHAFHSAGALRVARVIGSLDERRMIAFEWLPGRMLADLVGDEGFDRESLSLTGEALAEFHRQSAEPLDCWTREDEAEYVLALAGEIGFLAPRLASHADGFARRLAARLTELPDVHHPFHGDFSDGQVLVGEGAVAIVDLDSARCGDPADDLGAMVAQAESHALSGRRPPRWVATLRDAFLERYDGAGAGHPVERIGLYAALGLLRRARFAFRLRHPDWQSTTGAALERGARILSREC